MIEFGETLRRAREAKGLTIAQVSEYTRLKPQQIEDLERENFSRIAAPIYGRGFVKLYCEAVGIEPAPLVAEFMDIFTGNRQPAIRTRSRGAAPVQVQPPPPPVAPPPPQPVAPPPPPPPPVVEPTPAYPQPPVQEAYAAPAQDYAQSPHEAPAQSDYAAQSEYAEQTGEYAEQSSEYAESFDYDEEPPAIIPAYAPEAAVPPVEPAIRPARTASRYAPLRQDYDDPPEKKYPVIPPALWRFLLLAVVVVLLLWGLWTLGTKVWHAATVAPVDNPTPPSAESHRISAPVPVLAPGEKLPPRTPIPQPPLYID